jgi:hypothetical protein
MIISKLTFGLVALGALAGSLGCSAGAPGAGDPELTGKGGGALTSDDLAGLLACEVTTDTYADCIVDSTYPVYSNYTLTVSPNDSSKEFDFDAKAEITGKATSEGTPVRLSGYGFKGVWSWKPAPVTQQEKTVTTKIVWASFTWYCSNTAILCGATIIRGKKPFGPG